MNAHAMSDKDLAEQVANRQHEQARELALLSEGELGVSPGPRPSRVSCMVQNGGSVLHLRPVAGSGDAVEFEGFLTWELARSVALAIGLTRGVEKAEDRMESFAIEAAQPPVNAIGLAVMHLTNGKASLDERIDQALQALSEVQRGPSESEACPRCGGPNDHGDECVTELERKGHKLGVSAHRLPPGGA